MNISRTLQRNYPMVLVDLVLTIEKGIRCICQKNLTFNEWFFPEHFENNPIMPGSLQIEAMSQVAAIAMLGDDKKKWNQFPLILISIEKTRFLRPLVPGDSLLITAIQEKHDRGFSKFKCSVSISDKIASHSTLTYKAVSQNI